MAQQNGVPAIPLNIKFDVQEAILNILDDVVYKDVITVLQCLARDAKLVIEECVKEIEEKIRAQCNGNVLFETLEFGPPDFNYDEILKHLNILYTEGKVEIRIGKYDIEEFRLRRRP